MLTIFQDWTLVDGRLRDHARAEGHEIHAHARATCLLAETLIREGYDPFRLVQVVRADPYLFPAPHRIARVSLYTVCRINFFALARPQDRLETLSVLRGGRVT